MQEDLLRVQRLMSELMVQIEGGVYEVAETRAFVVQAREHADFWARAVSLAFREMEK